MLLEGLRDGFELITGGDDEVVRITLRTVRVAVESTAIAAAIGLPLGAVLGLARFRGRGTSLALANAGLRFPPIALGQLLWLLMWPDSPWGGGPLAGLGWIYTPSAVILAQTLLALPIVTALTAAAVQRVPAELLDQAAAFGAPSLQRGLLALREARVGVVAAVITGLGTAIASIGAILVIGSSLGTATLATAALSNWTASPGDPRAVAYGTVLLGLFLVLAAALTTLQHRRVAWVPGRLS